VSARRVPGGSRFLFDSFDAAQARIDANERVAEERWAAMEIRLGHIDAALERLERRLWFAVIGALGFLLAQGAETVLNAAVG
jgi:hypothetical protein